MKYTAAVAINKNIEVEFHPNLFEGKTEEEYLKEFSASFFLIDSWKEFVKFVVEQIAMHDEHFCEGLGRVETEYGQDWPEDPVDLAAKFKSRHFDSDVYIA